MTSPPQQLISILLIFISGTNVSSLQTRPNSIPRRRFLLTPVTITTLPFLPPFSPPSLAADNDLQFFTTKSGLQWADAKIGSGPFKTKGDTVAIDYSMSTTGARYGTKIYTNKDSPTAPYRWVLGDGSTIAGVELAIAGSVADDMPPMMPGGIRRVIVPSDMAYASLARVTAGMQVQDCQEGVGVGPIPPAGESLAEFQRFKNIYCNSNRPYQPDLVMDIKMYGKRTSSVAVSK